MILANESVSVTSASTISNPSPNALQFGISRLGLFSKEQAGLVYDALYKAMRIVPPPATAQPPWLLSANDEHEEKSEMKTRMRAF